METKEGKVSAEELARIYIKIRDAKEAAAERHKQEIASFNEQLDAISKELLDICKGLDVSSMRTGQSFVGLQLISIQMIGVRCSSSLKSTMRLDYYNSG